MRDDLTKELHAELLDDVQRLQADFLQAVRGVCWGAGGRGLRAQAGLGMCVCVCVCVCLCGGERERERGSHRQTSPSAWLLRPPTLQLGTNRDWGWIKADLR